MYDLFHKNKKLDSHNSPEEAIEPENSLVNQRAIWEEQIGVSKPTIKTPNVKERGDQLSNISLRPAIESDIDRIVDLDEQAKIASTGTGLRDRDRRRDSLIHMIHDPRFGVLVISELDKPVGMTIYDSQPEPIYLSPDQLNIVRSDNSLSNTQIVNILANRSGNRAHRLSTAINSESRGKGIGTAVINLLEERLKSQGIEAVSFHTGIDNIPMQKAAKGYTLIKEGADQDYTEGRLLGVK